MTAKQRTQAGTPPEPDLHEAQALVLELMAIPGRSCHEAKVAEFVTHNYVHVEALAIVRRRLGTAATARLADDLLPAIETIWVDEALHREAVASQRIATGSASLLTEIADGATVLERTYRIYVTGKFVLGDVTVNIAAGQITDTAGNANVAFNRTFAVNGATADVTNPAAGQIVGTGVINGWHYLEVTFRPSSGHAINPASVNGDEIVLKDPSGNVIPLDAPVRVAGTDRWQYRFTQNLGVGTYTVAFVAGTWTDNGGISNLAFAQTFRVEQATATLADPMGGATIDRSTLNTGDRQIDVTFTPVFGRVLDVDSIDGNEFTLTGANGENVTIGRPTRLGDTNTFRYPLGGVTFDSGTLSVNFIANPATPRQMA